MNENKNSTEATENSEIKMKIEGSSMNTGITINVRLDPHHVAPLLDEIRQTLAKQSGAEPSKPDEPAFGDQLTDAQGEVWACGPDGKWRCWYSDVQQWSDELDPTLNRAVIEKECGPLRPTTDEDRKRVGLPLRDETAGEPDEALAKALFCALEPDHEWRERPEYEREDFLDMARAAREHIEAHERQEHGPGTFGYCSERQARKDAEAALADITQQRDEWQARHKALREDVTRLHMSHLSPSEAQGTRRILDNDTERGTR